VTSAAKAPVADEQAPVPLDEVEKELSRQLRLLQKKDGLVHRVRMSNLIVVARTREEANRAAGDVPGIVAVHPARVLLLVALPGADTSGVTSYVRVRGHETGHDRQACTEQVTLEAAGASTLRLPFAVRSLLVGDLPTNVWWATNQPPAMGGPLLAELSERVQQIIYDSIGWLEPARGVAATAVWLTHIDRDGGAGRWRVASDLNWRRLKYWRRLVAQALDPASAPGAIESIREVVVEHGPHAVVQAWELVSFLAQRLGWQVLTGRVQPNVEIAWRFMAPSGELRVRIRRLEQGPPEIRRLRIECALQGQPAALELLAQGPNRLATVPQGVGGAPRTMTVPPSTLAELIGRQLSDRERDPVFTESMSVAQSLARSVLG
jgi:glucose-6-phosphate dehydrogenase assembly protein OpcA